MARLDFHPAAVCELEASADWYFERSPRAGQGFANAIEFALEDIEKNPDRFPKIDTRHRSCNVQKYPFQIIFRESKDTIHVVAVAHSKRRPGYWKKRR